MENVQISWLNFVVLQDTFLGSVMGNVRYGRTAFVITHRLSTIRRADQLLVVENGRIIECGTHDSLLAAGGFYADLYASHCRHLG